MRVPPLVAGIAALAVGLLVIRVGLVSSMAKRDPVRAASLWPAHPDLVFASGLDQVGRMAGAGQPIDRGLVGRMLATTNSAPLAPEPFLVRGVDAQLSGDEQLAGRAFAEARRRDPRSIPARYFLADHYLRTGQVRPGLDEVVTLVRLVPQSADRIAPYLAAFAKMPGGATHVKSVIGGYPVLELVLLRHLSADANNADTIMALWSGRRGPDDIGWQEGLVRELVKAGQFGRAHAVWARFAGRPAGQPLLNAPFDGRDMPPPFGWKLVSGPEGVAETVGEGQLHVLHYGRSNLSLASRMMLLPPGSYRMAMRVSGPPAAAKRISWVLRCLPSNAELTSFHLTAKGENGALIQSFNVPSGCAAQQMDLVASAPDFPEQADVTISAFQIRGGGTR